MNIRFVDNRKQEQLHSLHDIEEDPVVAAWKRKLYLALVVFITVVIACWLFGCEVADAQTVVQAPGQVSPFAGTRLLTDVSIGAGLGYLPQVDFGGTIEMPIGGHFELQSGTAFSPLTKQGFSGWTFTSDARVIGWLRPRVGIAGGFHYGVVKFGNTTKHVPAFTAGVAIRDSLGGAAGRLYINYYSEIGGCVWATASNPCPITASQLKGGEAYQEFRFSQQSHWRLGLGGGVYRGGSQVNPFAPQAGQAHYVAGRIYGEIRHEWGRIADSY